MNAAEKMGLEIVKLSGHFALLAASSIWRGYVLHVLWGWFIVRAFGLAPLTVPLAMGVSLIVGFLTVSHAKAEQHELGMRVWLATAIPALALLIGWIVTKFL